MKYILIILSVFSWALCTQAAQKKDEFDNNRDTLGIKYLDIVHCTHTDYGYTDHPIIALDLHKRYLDIALDMALESQQNKPGERFTWTAEALDPFRLWWEEASGSRRKDMLKMIKNGQIAVNNMPFHIAPFINSNLWDEMFDWIPQDLYKALNPQIGMQHDVNGFPRAAAERLLDKGIRYIWTGINSHWGGSPFKLPTAFWWQMPDGRKLLVWAGYPYWEGYVFFADREWRMGQHQANETQFSWPRQGDMLNIDEASVRKANKRCIERIEQLREEGYSYDFITLSFTNQWRMDNDGPTAELLPFVKKWNELGLKPYLNLTTAADAMKRIEKEAGNEIETLSGEWQDWWSFGLAASPRELQAARQATFFAKAAKSSVWGVRKEGVNQELKEIDRLLCRYYEHTFASNETSSNPYSLFNLGQLNEKGIFAYRSLERAKWLLARQLRSSFSLKDGGLYVANAGKAPYTGWVELEKYGFRGVDYKSVKEVETGQVIPLQNERGTRFWVENFQPESSKYFLLQKEEAVVAKQVSDLPVLTFDANNWVTSAIWKGMDLPLFTGGLADFMVLDIKDANRWSLGEYIHLDDNVRSGKIREITNEVWASATEKATVIETPHSWLISQPLNHPRVKGMMRTVEIFKATPRMHIKLVFDRISSEEPEIFYLRFPFPKEADQLLATNGGAPFVPYRDHLPNSCKDFFVTDSWVNYGAKDGNRIWSSVSTPLITFGGHHFCSRIETEPEDKDLYAMLYNNVWVVNYLKDCPGKMEFDFDIIFDRNEVKVEQIDQLVETYQLPIPVMLNPSTKENPHIYRRMNDLNSLSNSCKD